MALLLILLALFGFVLGIGTGSTSMSDSGTGTAPPPVTSPTTRTPCGAYPKGAAPATPKRPCRMPIKP
jgi:hypothetical protein